MALSTRTNEEHEMPGNARDVTTMAERRFPASIRIGLPPSGLGRRLTQMTAWLEENCGSDGAGAGSRFGADSHPITEFVPDSPLEGTGFELLVPPVDAGLFGRTGRK